MLTPAFSLEQSSDFITITIVAPYVKAADVEILIEGELFKFYAKPYFLRLHFPCTLAEDGRENAKYDVNKGEFTIVVPKHTTGEHFPNLSMLTSLLAKTKNNLRTAVTQPLIEVVRTEDGVEDVVEEDEEEFDWEMDQEVYEEEKCLTHGYKYGFASQLSGVFTRLLEEIQELVEISDPDQVSPQERRRLRLAGEAERFDGEHYLADLFECDTIDHVIKFEPVWCRVYDHVINTYKDLIPVEVSPFVNTQDSAQPFIEEQEVEFTEAEKESMRALPNKEYVLSRSEQQATYLSLVDIVFAYCYDHRVTEGENSSESAWNICKLSSTLSCLDSFTSVQAVVIGDFRRALTLPLFRNWSLCEAVLGDVVKLFRLGRQWLLRCLLECRSILQACEPHFILNDLYITDYCVWIQTARAENIKSLAHQLQLLKLHKQDINNFDLLALERAALEVYREDNGTIANDDNAANDNVSSDEESDSGSSSSFASSSSSDDSDESDQEVEDANSGNIMTEMCTEKTEERTLADFDCLDTPSAIPHNNTLLCLEAVPGDSKVSNNASEYFHNEQSSLKAANDALNDQLDYLCLEPARSDNCNNNDDELIVRTGDEELARVRKTCLIEEL